jgi:glycosyltransferase involved in cell wall biosynthesis
VTNDFLFTALRTIDVGLSCDPINPYNDHCTMNKVLEYMSFAKPQVLFDLKEGRASAGEAAVYVKENSAVKLAEAVDALLGDPIARDRMGCLGLERIRAELNWERSVQHLLNAYTVALTGVSL